MENTDVTQLRVGKHMIGIIGLKEALAWMAGKPEASADAQIADALVERLAKRNYIPDNIRELYAQAFLREFKKTIGLPVTEPPAAGLEIKVLGRGCPQCDRLDQEVMAAIAETRVEATLDHVRDVAEIGRFGVLGMPALLVNGKVVCVGSVPPRSKIKAWIEQAVDQKQP